MYLCVNQQLVSEGVKVRGSSKKQRNVAGINNAWHFRRTRKPPAAMEYLLLC